jgi:DNA-binding transcriptional regulator YhcF (GntR family)
MIAIDLGSAVPFEEQIRRELRHAIAAGQVRPGDRLPSARQLAGDLDVHWNTVARAYRRLHDDGLVTVGRGRSVVVRRHESTAGSEAQVVALLRDVVTEARLTGRSRSEIEALVGRELDQWSWEATG